MKKMLMILVATALVFSVAVLSIASSKEKGDAIVIEVWDQFTEEGATAAGTAMKKLMSLQHVWSGL